MLMRKGLGHISIRGMCNMIKISFALQRGFSPLHAASQNGHTDVVDLLVKAGAEIDMATTEVRTHKSIAKQMHTSLDAYVKMGDVPLGIAAQMGHVQTVERLLQAKANINHQNKVYTLLNQCMG